MIYLINSLQSGCKIHRITNNRIIRKISIPDIPHYYLSRRYTKTNIQRYIYIVFLKSFHLFMKSFLYQEGGCACGKRMILIFQWRSPKGENRIPYVFIDSTTVFQNHTINDMEEFIEYTNQCL